MLINRTRGVGEGSHTCKRRAVLSRATPRMYDGLGKSPHPTKGPPGKVIAEAQVINRETGCTDSVNWPFCDVHFRCSSARNQALLQTSPERA